MPLRQNHCSGQLIERVRNQTELRAMEQAKRVTWKRLAAAADEYTEWQVFGLWVRAVVEATGDIPTIVTREMETRAFPLHASIRPDLDAARRNGSGLGARIWEDVSQWAETNFFIAPKQAGWLDAVRYFSSMSLCSMQAWSHWESVDKQWRGTTPARFPSYPQWRSDVATVARLANPDSTAQQVLDSVRSVSEAEWSRLLHGFSGLMTFSLWMELVLEIEGPTSRLISTELADKYGGFSLLRGMKDSKEVVRALNCWATEHSLAIAGHEQMLAALSFQVRHHPAYPAMRSYALHCHDIWYDERPAPLPSFEQWREAADSYFEE